MAVDFDTSLEIVESAETSTRATFSMMEASHIEEIKSSAIYIDQDLARSRNRFWCIQRQSQMFWVCILVDHVCTHCVYKLERTAGDADHRFLESRMFSICNKTGLWCS
jgi:hypothetical protein